MSLIGCFLLKKAHARCGFRWITQHSCHNMTEGEKSVSVSIIYSPEVSKTEIPLWITALWTFEFENPEQINNKFSD